MLMLGYIPTRTKSHLATLQRKRQEYHNLVPRYFEHDDYEKDSRTTRSNSDNNNDDDNRSGSSGNSSGSLIKSFITRSVDEQKALRQVLVDVPSMYSDFLVVLCLF